LAAAVANVEAIVSLFFMAVENLPTYTSLRIVPFRTLYFFDNSDTGKVSYTRVDSAIQIQYMFCSNFDG
jgi:hypothetical protein